MTRARTWRRLPFNHAYRDGGKIGPPYPAGMVSDFKALGWANIKMTKRQKFKDPQGKHIRVYATLLNSPAYIVMGNAAKALFIDMRNTLTSTNNGDISAALSDMKHRGWSSPTTLNKALHELRAMGFIAVTRQGGFKQGTRICSLYRFTDLDVYQQPKTGVQAMQATHDYAQITSLRDAKRTLESSKADKHDEDENEPAQEKKAPIQKLYRNDTETVAIERFIDTETVQGAGLSLQKLYREISPENGLKPA